MEQADQHRIANLIDRLEAGTATESEIKELQDWFEAIDFKDVPFLDKNDGSYDEILRKGYAVIRAKSKKVQQKRGTFRILLWSAAAAIVLVLAGIGWKYFLHDPLKVEFVTEIKDIAPGHDGAVLTLADGKQVLLDSTTGRNIIKQGQVNVVNEAGQLSYDVDNQTVKQTTYNTLSTPRARQYGLVLPDGTKVWLNAGSSIRYPTAFIANERVVELSGEAYFEVVHNANQPFKVKVGNLSVNDIGTRFNISAYADEVTVKTTLLEGAVSVTTGLATKNLEPGQQASVSKDNTITTRMLTDPEDAIAWHQGLISLHGMDIASLFRQISRWYDVDIIYEGIVPQGRLSGTINRNTNLSSVVKMLAANEISCRIDGKKLIVSP